MKKTLEIPDFLLTKERIYPLKIKRGFNFSGYIERNIESFSKIIISFNFIEKSNGLFFIINPVSKLIFLLIFILTISFLKDLKNQVFISALIYIYVILSRINLMDFLKKIFFPIILFGFFLSFFSMFNFISEGRMVFEIIRFGSEINLKLFTIPQVIGITDKGIEIFFLLFLRVFNSISASFLVISSTYISDIFVSLKVLRVPDFFIMMLMLSVKYIDMLSKTIMDMFMARKSRVFISDFKNEKEWGFSIIYNILKKSIKKYEETFSAMISRGFNGEVKFSNLKEFNKIDFVFIFLNLFFLFFMIYDRN
jgi:cobalt/nickel transport system permease protein